MICYHIPKFGGHNSNSKNVILVCHVIKQDHLTEVIGAPHSKSPPCQV